MTWQEHLAYEREVGHPGSTAIRPKPPQPSMKSML